MSDESVEDRLLIEEYKSCRDLISKNIDIIEKTEVYAVGAAGATAVFSFSATQQIVATVSAWLPFVIALLGFVRFLGIDSTINKINTYLVALETKYPKLNWTTFYRASNKSKTLKKTRYGFWIVLGLLGFAFGIFMTMKGPFGIPPSPH
ncbi:hypothetical protein [uncultured Bradyrhizobium sp.]|uniref:hypothetical protein n=1 Tax=uncultured Bradyrhizobium sp. TaxID=199684 RepID=UPI0035CC2E72